ncbi:FAD-dependent oxidoreductase [Microbacterium sp. NPDC090218]
MNDTASPTSEILVVGAGIAAHRFVEQLLREPDAPVRVTVIGDEGRGPYDRSALARLFSGVEAEGIQLDRSVFRDDRVRLIRDDRVLRIDPRGHTVRTRARRTYSYDTLVLATGSFGARVAVEGADLPGCFGFRTIEDVEALQAFVESRGRELGRPLRGAVIGAGLHGLQAAEALHGMGVDTTVVQFPDRVLPRHLDAGSAEVLERAWQERGIAVRTRTRTTRLDPDESGSVASLEFQDGSFERTDVVVFTVGVRPRDELARNAGLAVHPRGGVLVDERCATSNPDILAIGDVACRDDPAPALVGSARRMADVAAARVRGRDAAFSAFDEFGLLRVGGIDIASFGDPLAHSTAAIEVVTHRDASQGTYRKLVLTDDGRTLLGGILIGDTSAYRSLQASVGEPLRPHQAAQLLPSGETLDAAESCDHLGLPPRSLYAAVLLAGLSTFTEIRARFGSDAACERCTLAIARVLNELAGQQARQAANAEPETADGALSRVHTDGSCVVVPTVRDGVLTPSDLLVIGRVAEDHGLRPRVVGARIELRGVRPEQLRSVIDRLAASGLAQGPRMLEHEPHLEEGMLTPFATGSGRSGLPVRGWGERPRQGRPHRPSFHRAENPA